tara:strand:- start:120 stop:344 length:225 start_codon:yes stop_codon:yes gene_type:complete
MEQSNDDNILRNINKIEKEVRELEKEKENIQQSCNHKGETFINFDERKSIKKFCSICKQEIGYASLQEQDDFLK